eukprot:9499542-Pyramimonas_sp.AAC.1
MYFPPRQASRALRPIYEKMMKLMIDWVTGVLQDMSRCKIVPIIFTDLKGGLCKSEDLVAGPFRKWKRTDGIYILSFSTCRVEPKCSQHLLLQPAVVRGG